jgi:branched-chain amino acid transport system permease protein
VHGDVVITFWQQTVNGVAASLLYVFVGVALTLIYGVARITDFSQGQIVTFAAFVGMSFSDAGVPFALAGIGAVVVVGLYAGTVHRLVLSRLGDDALRMFIVTLAIGVIVQAAMVMVWSADSRQFETSLDGVWDVGGVVITAGRVLILAVTVPVLAALAWWLTRTRRGRELRATAENRDAATVIGVDVRRSATLSYIVGCSLSGVVGVLLAVAFPLSPFSGGSLLLKGFAVALAGGLGSVSGAVVVGSALGLVETYASAYGITIAGYTFGTEWQNAYAFVLLIAVIVWRPTGLVRSSVS